MGTSFKKRSSRKTNIHTQKEDYIASNKYLESLLDETQTVTYDSTCIRKKSNMSKSNETYKFDSPNFSGQDLLNKMQVVSPKLHELIHKIHELDKRDMQQHGQKFKHFIFSDVKSGTHGARLIASGLIADGFHLGYSAELKKPNVTEGKKDTNENNENTESNEKRYKKIEIHTDAQLLKQPSNHFFLLSSVTVYDQSITTDAKKQMLTKFNQRPENIHGKLARIMILDSGFKEGIDLFDVKYVHIFEPSIVPADQKQVIGRGTRTCGQKGLDFHPSKGWPLYIFVYDLSIPKKMQGSMLGAETAIDLYLKSMNIDIRQYHFAHDLEKSTVLGSVDYDLNKNIHTFALPSVKNIEQLPGGSEFIYGGGPKLRIRSPITETSINVALPAQPISTRKKYDDMKKYVKEHFNEYTWDVVKMTNMCANTTHGGSGNVLNYTPTQNFIRSYFTPLNPCKGMLLWHSVGTGKTCTAIATATSSFEKQEYTILWVTRTTLKNDIWKNMFEQVCNESIRNKIQYSDDFSIPKEHARRMRLLSQSWKIRPISYKQFSNLVSKQNSIYETLVKINGEADPLRKTLIIIDEAHKLYGGEDLSSIERPDMNALHTALMKSYEISGDNSVRLMLMTATPITAKPMELIQLINLCKPLSEQMPSTFDEFSNEYLDVQGNFTDKGRYKYLDDISGYVSYLNREKDARQFAQPIVTQINVPMVQDEQLIDKFDKKIMREQLTEETQQLQLKLAEKAKEIEGDLNDLDKNRFGFLKKEVCETFDNIPKKQCDKVVNANIKSLIDELKELTSGIRQEMKDMKEVIKAKAATKKDKLGNIKENIEKYADEYQEYKDSVLYNIKHECAIVPDNATSVLKENIKEHPVIRDIDNQIEEYNAQIATMANNIKIRADAHKKKIAELRALLKKSQYNDLERNVVNMTIKEQQSDYNKTVQILKKENNEKENLIQKNLQILNKTRNKRFKKLQKTIKRKIRDNNQKIKEEMREEKRMKKELRKQADYKEQITNKQINEMVETYRGKMVNDLHALDENMLEQERAKEAEKQRKIDEREQKRIAREMERERKALEREKKQKTRKAEQAKRKMEREQVRKTKKNTK